MFHSHLIKLQSGIKNGNEVTLNLSSNVIGNSNNETKNKFKIKKSGGFLGRLLGPLLKTGLFSMKNVLIPLDVFIF